MPKNKIFDNASAVKAKSTSTNHDQKITKSASSLRELLKPITLSTKPNQKGSNMKRDSESFADTCDSLTYKNKTKKQYSKKKLFATNQV